MTKDTDHETGQSDGKICTKCGQWKSLEDYPKAKRMKDGRRSSCKSCEKSRNAVWRAENPEKMAAAKANWIANNPDKAKESAKSSREKRKDEAKEYNRIWKESNPDYFAQYREENKDKRREYNRQWHQDNPEKAKQKARRNYLSNRTSPAARLSTNMKSGISKAISRGSKRGRRTFDLLGYTIDELRAHLERLFHPGMTWENYGEWHVDHVTPVSAFNYETPDDIDFKRCWALSNLQPLWAIDNLKKSAKITEPFQPSLKLRVAANDNVKKDENEEVS